MERREHAEMQLLGACASGLRDAIRNCGCSWGRMLQTIDGVFSRSFHAGVPNSGSVHIQVNRALHLIGALFSSAVYVENAQNVDKDQSRRPIMQHSLLSLANENPTWFLLRSRRYLQFCVYSDSNRIHIDCQQHKNTQMRNSRSNAARSRQDEQYAQPRRKQSRSRSALWCIL